MFVSLHATKEYGGFWGGGRQEIELSGQVHALATVQPAKEAVVHLQ